MDGTTIWTWFLNLKGFKEAQGTMDGLGNSVNKNFAEGKKAQEDYAKSLETSNKQAQQAARQQRRAWVMAWMSIMWFSFTVKRMLEGFARSAVDTFMKVTDANNELNRGFTYLTATWEYFKFSFINTALGPILMAILPTLIDITDQITDWMNQNPEMAKMLGYLLIMGIVLGTILFWVAQIGLLTTGLSGVGFAAEAAGGSISILGISLSMSLGAALLLIGEIIVAIAVLYLAWKNNFGGMQQSVANIWNYLIDFITDIGSLFGNLFNLLDDLMQGNYEGVKEHTTSIVKLFIKMALEIIGIIGELGKLMWSILMDVAKVVVQAWAYGFATMINSIGNMLSGLINIYYDVMEKATGTKQPRMGTGDIIDVNKAVTSVGNAADFMKTPAYLITEGYQGAVDALSDSLLKSTYTHEETYKAVQEVVGVTSIATEEQKKFGAMLNTTSQCVSKTTDATNYFSTSTLAAAANTDVLTSSTYNLTDMLAEATVAQNIYANSLAATTKTTETMGTFGTAHPTRTPTISAGPVPAGYEEQGKFWNMAGDKFRLAMLAQYGSILGWIAAGMPGYFANWGSTTQLSAALGYAPGIPPDTSIDVNSMQTGGIVTKAGLFNLHAGEAVIPAGDNYSYGGISISINNPTVRSEADIDELAKKVGDKIKDAISRRVRLV